MGGGSEPITSIREPKPKCATSKLALQAAMNVPTNNQDDYKSPSACVETKDGPSRVALGLSPFRNLDHLAGGTKLLERIGDRR